MLLTPLGSFGWFLQALTCWQTLASALLSPPQERQEGSSMCPALTWDPYLRKTCPVHAVQCNRKTSVHHVTQDKVIYESVYLRWIQFLILEGTQARESCPQTVLSSLQSTHWATGCWRDSVSWVLSGAALRLPAPPHPPLITNNNQILLFAGTI